MQYIKSNKHQFTTTSFIASRSLWLPKGADIDGVLGDRFGWSVSLNAAGDVVVIGAPYNNNGGNMAGQVVAPSLRAQAELEETRLFKTRAIASLEQCVEKRLCIFISYVV